VDLKIDAGRFDGWMPIRFYWRDSSPFVDWCYRGAERLSDPFFDQSVERLLHRPFNLLFRRQTPIETLGALHDASPGLAPSGFIFHMSRCGSTLVAQMLAALAQNLVVSEPAPVDAVLRAPFNAPGIGERQQVEWLRWMISALGRKGSDAEKHYFLKLDAWSVLQLPVIEKAFPGVPWIFLYREPIEVMVSQLRRRGAHMIPGVLEPALFGMDAAAIFRMSPEEYVARVLAKICESALGHRARENALLVNYTQLPEAVYSHLPEFFKVTYTADELELMRRSARSDAKNPALPFADDSDAKQRAADESVREAARRFVAPLYARLEAARAARSDRRPAAK
jgi:hypothetical protein